MEHPEVTELRVLLWDAGYAPIPLYGKVPPTYGKNNQRGGLDQWQKLGDITPEMIKMHGKQWPDAINTGVLTYNVPTIDIDILDEDAAKTAEACVREFYQESGEILIRYGLFPKRAIPFRTDDPFPKITANLTAPNGKTGEKIEFLCSGQQFVVDGIHPDTKQPYRWIGKKLKDVRRENLPYIHANNARALVDEIVNRLEREHGYGRATERPTERKGNGETVATGGAEDWQFHFDNIHNGHELHDNICRLAAKMVKAGANSGAAVNQLRALMNGSTVPHDARWQERYDDIPRAVESAVGKYAGKPSEPTAAQQGPPSTIKQTLAVFNKWLILEDHTPILAVLGTVAANLLPGDPVWLGVIAPPSSAKTEILNALSKLPQVAQAATITAAGLLSGTPKKQQAAGARGGLLRQLGEFGIICMKDFGSVLSMHTETRAETLAALREIYDGAWTRHLGSDGGKTLSWKGKIGFIFASTEIIDSHYAVIGALGDRFLLSRLATAKPKQQFARALHHVGATTKQMRDELATAVAALFAGRKAEPRPINPKEISELGHVISLVVRLRGTVMRDYRSKEIEAIYGAEGTARIGLALERLLAGLDTLGVSREMALSVVKRVALDSLPPLRRRAYECVHKHRNVETADVAIELGLPSVTARRILEDLAAHGLIARLSQGPGKPDLWDPTNWDTEPQAADQGNLLPKTSS